MFVYLRVRLDNLSATTLDQRVVKTLSLGKREVHRRIRGAVL